MPLLWKSWRKRKQQQQQQRQASGSSTTESASSSIELPPSLQEVEEEEGVEEAGKNSREGEVIFAMVIQDFNKSACDELSVRRGQMVQPLYNDGTWLYVRNIDGCYGYIPANFCSPLDQMKDLHWKAGSPRKATRKVRPRRQSIHDLVKPTLHSSASCYDSLPSTPAVAHLSSLQSSPRNPRIADTSFTDSQTSAAELLVRQEVGATDRPQPRAATQNMVLHPLHPLSFTQRVEATELQRRQNLEGPGREGQQQVRYTGLHDRTNSYHEAVIATEENLEGRNVGLIPPQVVIRRPSRPAHLPLTNNTAYDHLESYRLDTMNRTTTEGAPTSSRESQLADDDVFLPAAHKPMGIYRVLEDFVKQVQGEVSVRRNEYVIVMDLGMGEWAGVTTAAGVEGLVPKCLLRRYCPQSSPRTVTTQTELMIVAPSVFNIGTGSSTGNSQSAQREVVSIREISLPLRQRRRRRRRQSQVQQPTTETAIQTDAPPVPSSCSPPHRCHLQPPQAWASKNSRLENSFWYENSISIPQLTRHDSSSTQTLPSLNGFVQKQTFASPAFHSSHQSITHRPPLHDPPPPPPLILDSDSLNSDSSLEGPKEVQRVMEEVDNGRELKQGEAGEEKDTLCPVVTASAVADIPDPSIPPKPPQIIMLTAVKGFIPSDSQSDSLPLQRGDVLQLTPDDIKLQDGLIWAYHTGLEMHGFVPRSHMAYLYLTPHRRKRNPSSIDDPV